MLSRLHFSNFKSWAEADLSCGRITGVFGTNSSGKTSLIQLLLLLKQTKDATDRALSLDLNGALVQLGTIKEAIHQHDEKRTITVQVAFDLDTELSLNDPSLRYSTITHGKQISLTFEVAVEKDAPVSRLLAYSLGGMEFSLVPRTAESNQFQLQAKSFQSEENAFSFTRNLGRAWPLPPPVKSYAFPDQARTYYQNAGFLSDLEVAYEECLDNIF